MPAPEKGCFNEAAGIPRGRPGCSQNAPIARKLASMRPRVFPAEDLRCPWTEIGTTNCFNEAAGIPRGRRRRLRLLAPARAASMRPRVFPAEDFTAASLFSLHPNASMRPRVFPAEDAEAAAAEAAESLPASMRPRVFPAEDLVYLATPEPGCRQLQ